MRYSSAFHRQLGYAAHDCAQRGGDAVGVDHLLMGLYREDFPLVDEVFATFRVDSLKVLERLFAANPESGPPGLPDGVGLTPEALRAIDRAEIEAESLGHDSLEPPHTLLGILALERDRLQRYFIREELVRQREDEVLTLVREVVSWLRFVEPSGVERELDVIDRDTVVGFESVPMRKSSEQPNHGFAVRMRMIKRF